MTPSPGQIAAFDNDGYLFFPGLFAPNEVYLSLCAVSNHIRRCERPEYIARRDFTPITCLPDDCLRTPYPVDPPWASGMPARALETSPEELRFDS